MNFQELSPYEAIRQAMALYNNAGDRGEISEMMEAFTDDAVLDTTKEEIVGAPAIESYFHKVVSDAVIGGPDRRPARHHLTTSRIELESADTARAWTYFILIRDGVTVQTGIYVDRFSRRGNRWLISRRRVKLEYDADAR